MPLQISRDLTVSLGDSGQPETFTPLTGLTARRFSLTATLVETTDMASPSGWRELARGAGGRAFFFFLAPRRSFPLTPRAPRLSLHNKSNKQINQSKAKHSQPSILVQPTSQP